MGRTKSQTNFFICSKRMSNKHILPLLTLIAAAGLCVSLFLVHALPLWLDERYSLVFASRLNIGELLYHSQDVHPGVFYVALKLALNLTNDIYLLRTFLSVLPQWIGCGLLVFWMNKKKLRSEAQLLGAGLIFLNPFIIYSTIHLRMYGLVVLIAATSFLLFRRWYDKQTEWRLATFVFSLLLGNSVSYSFFFISISFCTYMFLRAVLVKQLPAQRRRSLIVIAVIFGAFVLEFLMLAGFSVKRIFESGSWIPLPSLTNVQSLAQTIIGLETNYFLSPTSFGVYTMLFYVVLIVLFRMYWKSLRSNTRTFSELHQMFFAFVMCPTFLLLLVSFTFPILSQRVFFYQFIPKLSLFLPRIFLPIIVFGSVLVAMYLSELRPQKHVARNLGLIIGATLLLSIGWAASYRNIYSSLRQMEKREAESQRLLSEIQSIGGNEQSIYLMPSWFWLRQVSPMNLDRVNDTLTQVLKSEQMEKVLLNEYGTCAQVNPGVYVGVEGEASASIQKYYQRGTKLLDVCCLGRGGTHPATFWSCR